MEALLSNPYFALPLTLGIYLIASALHRRVRWGILHPLLITIVLLIALLHWSGVSYDSYRRGSAMIDFCLGPSVVALGYTMYEQVGHLKGNVLSILTSLFLGAIVGVLSVMLIAHLMGATDSLVASMQPKSVTTPIAMIISERSGGIPSLTAVIVVISGILGGVIGPPLMKLLRIESRVAKGLALGAAAHGVGTSVAIQLGAVEGALGGLAIGIMGVLTSVIIPIIEVLF